MEISELLTNHDDDNLPSELDRRRYYSVLSMASSVFYKFKSQRDESRVTFDGTAISVFDLKKEIILANNLGKANDFDLYVYDASTNQGASSSPALLSNSSPHFLRIQG